MDDMRRTVVPYYQFVEVQFYERWHWRPSDLEGMPISEREELLKLLVMQAQKERPKNVPTAPQTQNAPHRALPPR